MSGWCIDNHNLSIHDNDFNEDESLNDNDGMLTSRIILSNSLISYIILILLDLDITSVMNMTLIKCSDICLRSKWSLHDIEAAGFVSSDLHKNGLLGDIMQVYSSYYSMNQALLST